jgi:hypothetical protein
MIRLTAPSRSACGVLLAALVAFGATAAAAPAQTARPESPPPPPSWALYEAPPSHHRLAAVTSACGGDFGMLGEIESEVWDRPNLDGTFGTTCHWPGRAFGAPDRP